MDSLTANTLLITIPYRTTIVSTEV